MKKFMKIMVVAALTTGVTTGASAKEQVKETDKPGPLYRTTCISDIRS